MSDSCLHQSVFSAVKRVLKHRGALAAHLGMLTENFRMNDQLCAISQHIYGAKYLSVPHSALRYLDSSVVSEKVRVLIEPLLLPRIHTCTVVNAYVFGFEKRDSLITS